MKLLLVCLGNICRSPTAEAVLRAKSTAAGLDWHIDSAGTASWHSGKPPYGPMQEAAASRGYDLSSLRARQVVRADFERFDYVLAMDQENLADLTRLRPASATAALRLFLEDGSDVPDPYFTRDFDGCLSLIEEAADRWVADLS